MKNEIISASPDIMGGTPVFAGTRVPIQTLLDYLEAGESIDDFLEGFSTVTREAGYRFPGGGKGPSNRSGLVKVLLDECIDWRLARDIVGHDVRTARQMGWTTV